MTLNTNSNDPILIEISVDGIVLKTMRTPIDETKLVSSPFSETWMLPFY